MALRNPWAIASITSAGIFITFLLRFSISPVAPIIAKELKLTDFQLGLVFSAFLWVYTFLQPMAGWAADKFGAKRTLLVGVLASSVITILTGFAGSFAALIILRIAFGMAQTPNFVTGAKVTASKWFGQEQLARATSIWIAGARLGTVITLPLAAWLAVDFPNLLSHISTSLTTTFTWQWAFFVIGLIGLMWSIFWVLGFQNNPRTAPISEDSPRHTPWLRALPVLLSPLGLGLTVASFGQGYIAYYLNFWLPAYLVKEQKFTVVNAGIYSALPFLSAIATVILVGGLLSDRLVSKGSSPVRLRSNLFSIGMATVAMMLFVTAYAPNAYFAITSLSLAGVAWGISTPSLWAALVEATPKEITGAMGGVQNFGGNLGGIVVSVFTGYIIGVTGTFFFAILAASAAASVGSLSALLLVRPPKQLWSLQN